MGIETSPRFEEIPIIPWFRDPEFRSAPGFQKFLLGLLGFCFPGGSGPWTLGSRARGAKVSVDKIVRNIAKDPRTATERLSVLRLGSFSGRRKMDADKKKSKPLVYGNGDSEDMRGLFVGLRP